MSGETLEDLAARVAPTLTSNCWAAIEFTVDHPDHPACVLAGRSYTVNERRALLAYRDKVAAGLPLSARYGLRLIVASQSTGEATAVASALVSLGLAHFSPWAEATTFGVEVDRVLLADGTTPE